MSSCNIDSDCEAWEVCTNLICKHKSLSDPIPSELAAWIILPIILGMINIGGQNGALT